MIIIAGDVATRPRRRHTGRRSTEVLALLAEGLSNQAVAQRLFLSRKTVEHHVRGVFTKLGVSSRAEAVAYAVRHRLS